VTFLMLLKSMMISSSPSRNLSVVIWTSGEFPLSRLEKNAYQALIFSGTPGAARIRPHCARSRRIHAVCGLQRLRFASRCNDGSAVGADGEM